MPKQAATKGRRAVRLRKLPRLDLGIVIPQLDKYGGAERYLVECLRVWQDRHGITLYASSFNDRMLAEHGVSDGIRRETLAPYFEGPNSSVLNALLLPKIWKQQIGRHALYHTHLWPTHLIDLHPMVWYPHEPLRILSDLRFEQNVDTIGASLGRDVHIYPKFNYDQLADVEYEAFLAAVEANEQTARPERIVANSRYTAAYLQEVYGREVKDVVYPGVDHGSFMELPTDPNLFVTIAQLWPHKRVNLLIEAIALTDQAQLIVIGDGPERERLTTLTERLGVADRVFFLSGLSNFELSIVLARACAFLFAPINEPFGIVVLEAMAAGKPIIAVDEGGYVEALNSDCAALLPPFPSAFAEKMSHLQRAPELVAKMGAASRAAVRGFSWAKAADELETILIDTWRAHTPALHAAAKDATTLFGAQYYVWYGDGFGAAHWNDTMQSGYVSDKPMLGYYPSSKGRTIEYHLGLFERMGLDFAVPNLHVDAQGTNRVEQVAIQHLFDVAERRRSKVRFAVQLAPYADDADVLKKAVAFVRRLASRANYLTIDGKPVLFWFWSSAHDGNKALVGALKAATRGFTNIAVGLRLPDPHENRHTFGLFDGFAPYSPLELSRADNWDRVWSKAYGDAEAAGMGIRLATVSPGYDDRALHDEVRVGNPYRLVDREGGKTYATTMDAVRALSPRPDIVMVSTFNEYHENTHIEPSQRNGMQYVDMTARFISDWRKREAGDG